MVLYFTEFLLVPSVFVTLVGVPAYLNDGGLVASNGRCRHSGNDELLVTVSPDFSEIMMMIQHI